jgi:RNA polymerase sigma factor (sigma-70 family)
MKELINQIIYGMKKQGRLFLDGRTQDMEDVFQIASIGYMKARESFNDGMGIPFGVYARFRIQGEVLDWQRKSSGLTGVKRGIEEHPSTHNMDDYFFPMLQSHEPTPEDMLIKKDNTLSIINRIEEIGERHAEILFSYYFKHKTLKEIGVDLGVTESRVCQLMDEALGKLRMRIRIKGDERMGKLADWTDGVCPGCNKEKKLLSGICMKCRKDAKPPKEKKIEPEQLSLPSIDAVSRGEFETLASDISKLTENLARMAGNEVKGELLEARSGVAPVEVQLVLKVRVEVEVIHK